MTDDEFIARGSLAPNLNRPGLNLLPVTETY